VKVSAGDVDAEVDEVVDGAEAALEPELDVELDVAGEVEVELPAVVAVCPPVCETGEVHPINRNTSSGIVGTGVCLAFAFATWTS
jgi:hypothetical protein